MARPAGYSSDEFSEDDDGLSCSVNVSRPIYNGLPQTNGNSSKEEKLIDAVLKNQLEEVKNIVNSGVKIDYKSSKYKDWTALMHACYEGNFDIINFLLENNASTKVHHNLVTPLLCLCDSRNSDEDELIKCLDILTEYEADIHNLDWFKTSAVTYAVKKNNEKLVLELLSRGCDLESADFEGWTPVFHAVNSGYLSVTKILKDAGANMKKIDRRGNTLNEIAVNKNNKELIAYISSLEKVNDVNLVSAESERIMGDFEFIFLEQPDRAVSRFKGYHNDLIHWVNGIGLKCLVNLFIEKNVQLNELLTIDDNGLKELGVVIPFHRKKIKYCVQKFHEHNWGQNSLLLPPEDGDMDFCTTVNTLSSVLHHLHICSATSYYWKKNLKCHLSQKDKKNLTMSIRCIQRIEKETKDILQIVNEIEDTIIPSDLIKPTQTKSSSKFKFILASCVGIYLLISKSNLIKMINAVKIKL